VSADAAEWLGFAAADLRAAKLLITDTGVPFRIACFHAQQAAEKAMKAVLVAEATPFRRTHDIIVLKGLLPARLATQIDSVVA
jgi:HEPN domain-containing protein